MTDPLVDAVVEIVERAFGRRVEPPLDAGGEIAEQEDAAPAPQPPVLLVKGVEQVMGRLRARDLGRQHLPARVRDQHQERLTPGGRDGGAAEARRRRIARELPDQTAIEQPVPRAVPRRLEVAGERFAQGAGRRGAQRRFERLDRERERARLGPERDRQSAPQLTLRRFEVDLVELEQELIESARHRPSRARATETLEQIDQLAPVAVGERGQRRLERLFAQGTEQRIVERGDGGHAGEPELERAARR